MNEAAIGPVINLDLAKLSKRINFSPEEILISLGQVSRLQLELGELATNMKTTEEYVRFRNLLRDLPLIYNRDAICDYFAKSLWHNVHTRSETSLPMLLFIMSMVPVNTTVWRQTVGSIIYRGKTTSEWADVLHRIPKNSDLFETACIARIEELESIPMIRAFLDHRHPETKELDYCPPNSFQREIGQKRIDYLCMHAFKLAKERFAQNENRRVKALRSFKAIASMAEGKKLKAEILKCCIDTCQTVKELQLYFRRPVELLQDREILRQFIVRLIYLTYT